MNNKIRFHLVGWLVFSPLLKYIEGRGGGGKKERPGDEDEREREKKREKDVVELKNM